MEWTLIERGTRYIHSLSCANIISLEKTTERVESGGRVDRTRSRQKVIVTKEGVSDDDME